MFYALYDDKRALSGNYIRFYGVDSKFAECLRGNRGLLFLLILGDIGKDGKYRLTMSNRAKYAKILGITKESVYRIYRGMVKCGLFKCDEDRTCYVNPLIAFDGDEYKRVEVLESVFGVRVKKFRWRDDLIEFVNSWFFCFVFGIIIMPVGEYLVSFLKLLFCCGGLYAR